MLKRRPLSVLVIILVLFVSLFGSSSCSVGANTPASPPVTPKEPDRSIASSPEGPMILDLSFPQGAPRLNQTAELRCVLRVGSASSNNVTVKINLPDGLQLVSGKLSAQFENVARNDVKEMKIVIKPLKTGNYTIEAVRSFIPRSSSLQPGPGLFKIYLSVSETSAEWGRTPPWVKPEEPKPPYVTPQPTPIKPTPR